MQITLGLGVIAVFDMTDSCPLALEDSFDVFDVLETHCCFGNYLRLSFFPLSLWLIKT